MVENIIVIANQFNIEGTILEINNLNSGHINDTYLVNTNTNQHYVLQKLNGFVFKNTIDIINNKVYSSQYIEAQVEALNTPVKCTRFYKTNTGYYYYKDKNEQYWNMQNYIANSITYDKAPNAKVVFEAGKLYGSFMMLTKNIVKNKIKETLPNFHNIPIRINQFEKALSLASNDRKLNADNAIKFVLEHKKEMCRLAELKSKNTFPIRITHNDAKLANVLFDKDQKGLAVIDLDTVMPGIVHFDFGDSIRSICTNKEEDSNEYESIEIQLDYYEAFCKGYAFYTSKLFTDKEIEYLPLGVKTIVFIMGLRFLTDYLNNDIYYKTNYENHNLVRANNQFYLLKSVINNYDSIKQITKTAFKLNNIS
ncbi:aminoglycoside phosphotransferase family protein [uncultured Lacinutrix sp.]|uniref:phosphotransferase enzyme family protein n=1 Tax=uncultured Lacinutrix sp. TaxID=574032 RepID=UPI002601C7D5|nr:aminoglycoside phosphotransferase family protein [uncultured Lacinutrix sp.]